MKRFLFLLLLSTHAALGQNDDSITVAPFPPKSDFRSSVLAEYGISGAYVGLPAIRTFFRENSIEADPRLSLFIHTGLGYRRQRFKLILRFEYGVDPTLNVSKTPSTITAVARRQNVRNNILSFGYDIANTRNRRVFINAGVGAVRYEYSIFRLTNQVVSFQDILNSSLPGSLPSLTLTNSYWDVNVEFSQREKRSGDKLKGSGFQFVSHLGYRRGWRTSAWASEAYQITGGPADQLSQVYVQFGFYIGYNYNRRNKS